jgi:hypothetical protein
MRTSLERTSLTPDKLPDWKPDSTTLQEGQKVVTANTSDQGIPILGSGDGTTLVPAERTKIAGVLAGTTAKATGPFTIFPRGTGIAGWSYLFTRDPDVQFDTVILPGLARTPGLSGNDLWSSIVFEIADASDETSTSVLFGSAEILAKATLAVTQSADVLGELRFTLTDPTGRPIVLGPHNLPARYCARYRAENGTGTDAVAGEARSAIGTDYFVSGVGYSIPTLGSTAQVGTALKVQGGTYGTFNGAQRAPFSFVLSADRADRPIRTPEGRYNLPNWLAQLAKIQDGQTVTATILGVGDSWMHNNIRFAKPIAKALKQKFGDAGPGFLGFAYAFGAVFAGGVDDSVASLARAGTWADDLTTNAKGLDAYSVSSSTVGSSIIVTLTATGFARRAKLHYWAQPGGGDVRWRAGAGAWTTISTAAASAGMAIADIDFGAEITATTITLEVLTAGSGVILHGVDLRRDVTGVRFQKLGHSGGKASHFVEVDEAVTLTELASLSPDLVLICFTTNELTGGVAPATMGANIETFIRRVRKARPYCDFLLIAPFDNSPDGTVYPWAEYETELARVAVKHRAGFFPTQALIGTWGDGNRRGLVQDTIPHPTSAGGYMLSGVLLRDFLNLGI